MKDVKRAWQRMLSGRRLDLLDPSPLDIELEDIAHGLARVARWNGQTSGEAAFSVAQHSLLVDDIAARLKPGLTPNERLCTVLHDAAEYVIGDLITPFKSAVGPEYKVLEKRLMTAIRLHFGLPAQQPEALTILIKRADRIAAYLEATQLAGFATAEARRLFGHSKRFDDIALTPWPPGKAKRHFLERCSRHGGGL
ncbi:MAG: hydrolase [Bacteroidota bacterium]|nr:HD family hydrolase [Kiloniellaceae bacterium]